MKSWIRDIFLIPLIVGLVVAVFSFGIPKIFEKGKELSYSIDGPTTYLNRHDIGNIKVEINDEQTQSLSSYKIRIVNSGNVPIKDIPVTFKFNTSKKDFKIFNVTHKTKPPIEFGDIKLLNSDDKSRRFLYKLLNPDDEDTITFLTNDTAELGVYTKVEGMKVNLITNNDTSLFKLMMIFVSIIASLSSILMLRFK